MILNLMLRNPYKNAIIITIFIFFITLLISIYFITEVSYYEDYGYHFSVNKCEKENCLYLNLPLIFEIKTSISFLFLNVILNIVFSLFIGTSLYSFLKNKQEKINIHEALKEKNILCYYQPIIDLKSFKIVGCEVLMRLEYQNKIYQPNEVIPLIMKNKLSWKLTEGIIRKSIRELNAINIEKEFKIAYNITATDVNNDKIKSLVNKSYPNKKFKFNLEITEHEALSESNTIIELQKLQKEGFLISVDDFGKGYSNFASLREINPDVLKIDKSFIFALNKETAKESFVSTIAEISKKINAKIVAEGVEDIKVIGKLKEMDIDYVQGYYYSKPISIKDFEYYLKAYDVI